MQLIFKVQKTIFSRHKTNLHVTLKDTKLREPAPTKKHFKNELLQKKAFSQSFCTK